MTKIFIAAVSHRLNIIRFARIERQEAQPVMDVMFGIWNFGN